MFYYAIQTYKASGKYKFFDSYPTLKIARKAALEFVREFQGSKAEILKETALPGTPDRWEIVEVYRG